MHIIQPCCVQKHLMELRNALGTNGTKKFEGYGDLSLTELLPAMLIRYSETRMIIAAPSLPDQATEVIAKWMKQKWSQKNGFGKLDAINHLTILADLSPEKSPEASDWLKANPFGDRLTLVNIKQEDTAIVLPDFAITGPVNMRYGYNFTATATTDGERIAALWERFRRLAEPVRKEEPAKENAPADGDKPAGKAHRKSRQGAAGAKRR